MYETCGVRYGSMVYYVVCMGLCLSVRCRRFFDLTFCLDFSGAVCGLKNASCASLLRYFCVSLLLCVVLLVDDAVVFVCVSAGAYVFQTVTGSHWNYCFENPRSH